MSFCSRSKFKASALSSGFAFLLLFPLASVTAENRVVIECPILKPIADGDSIAIPVLFSNDVDLEGFCLPFSYNSDDVEITSVSFEGSSFPPGPILWQYYTVFRPVENQVVVAGIRTPDSTEWSEWADPTLRLAFTMYVRVPLGTPNQCVNLDSSFVPPANHFLFASTSVPQGAVTPNFYDCGTCDIQIGEYRLDVEHWSFGNEETNMWPESHWNGIGYCGIITPCERCCILCSASDFPDWWVLFVSALGTAHCYFDPPPGPVKFRPSALAQWEALRGDWTGSCFGFAASSFLFYDEFLDVETEFPGYDQLNNVPLTDDSRALINKLYLHQFGFYQQELMNAAVNSVTPAQTWQAFYALLGQTPRDDRVLMLFNQSGSGGHAVAPYRSIQDGGNPDVWYIYVHDSNFPDDTTKRIAIDVNANSWSYSGQPGWGGSHGLFLLDSVSNYLSPLILADTAEATEHIRFYFGKTDSAVFESPLGTIGFDQNGTNGTVNGGFPIIPADGEETSPIGYFLPTGEWYFRATGVVDGVFTIFDGQKRIFRNGGAKSGIISAIYRYDAQAPSLTSYGTGTTPGREICGGNFLEVISITPDSEIVVQLSGLETAPGDSVALTLTANQEVQFDNFGGETSYDLLIQIVSQTVDTIYYHEEVPIGSTTSHRITPDWRPHGDSVVIAVDTSMSGNFNDSTIVVLNGSLPQFVCGDPDGNGIVTISDAVFLINYVFGGGPAPEPLLSGDADCSGIVTISDAVYLIQYIFGGGPAPCEG